MQQEKARWQVVRYFEDDLMMMMMMMLMIMIVNDSK